MRIFVTDKSGTREDSGPVLSCVFLDVTRIGIDMIRAVFRCPDTAVIAVYPRYLSGGYFPCRVYTY